MNYCFPGHRCIRTSSTLYVQKWVQMGQGGSRWCLISLCTLNRWLYNVLAGCVTWHKFWKGHFDHNRLKCTTTKNPKYDKKGSMFFQMVFNFSLHSKQMLLLCVSRLRNMTVFSFFWWGSPKIQKMVVVCGFLHFGKFWGWPAGEGKYLHLFRFIAFCFLTYWGSDFTQRLQRPLNSWAP